MWNISISFHRNISNHTIFLINFSSSFHWCYLYTHLINSEKYFFQAMRDLTIELSKWWQKCSFPGLWSMQLFYRHCWDPKWWFAGKYIYDYIFSIKLTFLFYFPWTKVYGIHPIFIKYKICLIYIFGCIPYASIGNVPFWRCIPLGVYRRIPYTI